MTTESALHFASQPCHVLLTGATGFVGSALTHALLADGHRVTILTRDRQRAARLFPAARGVEALDQIADNDLVDVVINLAGARILGPRWSKQRKQTLLDSRVGLTQRLVAWIAKTRHKPALLLSASAVGYYGVQPQNDTRMLDESAPPQAIFMSQLCREWEEAAAQARDFGVQVACMRFGMVLGHGGALPPMMMPVRLGLGGPIGGGKQALAWIHLHDLLRGIAHLMQQAEQQRALAPAYNFTAPGTVTQGEFVTTAARILQRPAFLPTPALPVRLLLGEQADIVLEGQRAVPAQLEREAFTFHYATAEQALRDLLIDQQKR
ncbi:TIGR01777 family oxidoreductase [uncultured Oxalicibacterium sp.]|uniref:TIGR01777 family oxidoreductase n=1 Tax=uncultured Oxalicibacterium sp. TaxID=1168540 RepID=UPI0025E9AF23|nr:TIGR01777 family oxidoreductase [uncultured Oxalicibacterium sp.]